jgi:hypothetical protein
MLRLSSIALAAWLGFSLTSLALAAPPHKHPAHKRHYGNNGSVPGYGFLPGVRTPQQIERERARRYYASGPHFYGPAIPGFYRGRWNGGGFGPCYTQTPIGYQWNCGR